jgi:hypothetical protein
MNSEKEALQRVQGALYHLRRGLAPFVEARMKMRHGPQWQVYASRATGGDPRGGLDEYALLKTMVDQWRDAFEEAFPRVEKHRVRNFVSTALEARNATAHLSIPLQDNEALRYLDAVHQILRAVKAPEAEIAEVRGLYDAQRRSGVSEPALAAPAVAPAPEPTEGPAKQLRPWIEVAFPHPDVLENRFKESEFAADLFAVDAGIGEGDYATPRGFFWHHLFDRRPQARAAVGDAAARGWGRRPGHRAADGVRRRQDAHPVGPLPSGAASGGRR